MFVTNPPKIIVRWSFYAFVPVTVGVTGVA